MKKVQLFSVIILILAVFISIDLGINFANSLVPELNDGIGSRSILQTTFGILGGADWTQAKFLSAFEISVWVSFLLFIENIVVWILRERNR